MSTPNFKAVHAKNHEQYGLSKERYEELKAKGSIIFGEFIQGLPVVFHTNDPNQNLNDFLRDSIRKFHELEKSAAKFNKQGIK